MRKEQVNHCAFSSWFNQFKEFTIKSHILPIPDDVLTYLRADGVVLPKGSLAEGSGETDSGDEVDWDEDTEELQAPEFPKFEADIKKAIKSLGGVVFPKLNWSAPRDASWISPTNSLKCSSPADIFLLLKSSDFISHDLTYPYDHCIDCDSDATSDIKYELVLRRWHDLNLGAEYRCFVRDKTLIGISLRHHSCYFPHIKQQEEAIVADIEQFFYDVIQDKFPDSDYVFDVYRKDDSKVYVIDFNPFGEVTDSLLFSWEELTSDELDADDAATSQETFFRYLKTSHGVQPNEYQKYAVPSDFVHLSTGQDPHKLIDLLKMKTQNEDESTSEDEREDT